MDSSVDFQLVQLSVKNYKQFALSNCTEMSSLIASDRYITHSIKIIVDINI